MGRQIVQLDVWRLGDCDLYLCVSWKIYAEANVLLEQRPGNWDGSARHPQKRNGLGRGLLLSSDAQNRILPEHERRTPQQARKQFMEWASLFSRELFVMLGAFADESFADDTPGRIPVSAFGGYIASVEEWAQFSLHWQKTLNDYDVKFFHFSEWRTARAVAGKTRDEPPLFHKNNYRGWKLEKLTSFLHELARIANAGKKISFGGFTSLERFNERKVAGEILLTEDHRNYCRRKCFGAFVDAVNTGWAGFSGRVSFVWDETQNVSWKQSIIAAYEPFKRRDLRFGGIGFDDDKICLPLQAADMVSYRIRQKVDIRFKEDPDPMSDFDKVLFSGGTIRFRE